MDKDLKNREYAKREVIYCSKCGWESFDPDSFGDDCGQYNCDGQMIETRIEDYEI